MIDLVGYLAGILTIISFLPQVIKSWRSRKIDDLSKGTGAALIFASMTWIVYGVLLSSMPMIITNSIVLICVILIFLVHFI